MLMATQNRLHYLVKRLRQPGRMRRLLLERGSEPLHMNLIALPVAFFGSYRTKVDFDLASRRQYAWPLLFAADQAKRLGINTVSVSEFGVAAGGGLLNMCELAERTTKATGIGFRVYGFDTGTGMPPPIDYRDQPDRFQRGDFPMGDPEELRRALPSFAELILGDIESTVEEFLKRDLSAAPLAFVSIDVDYYSSAKKVLRVFRGAATSYLPTVAVYLDDVGFDDTNPWNGELLAVAEFNEESERRKIAPFSFLRARRLFKNAMWIDRMFAAHIFDHPSKVPGAAATAQRVISNEYLSR
jgi:hypothetical protein